MKHQTFAALCAALLTTACAGPYTMEEVNVEGGMVVGSEQVNVGSDGQIQSVSQEGYVPDNRYLDAYETGGVNLGPNAPGYIPGSVD